MLLVLHMSLVSAVSLRAGTKHNHMHGRARDLLGIPIVCLGRLTLVNSSYSFTDSVIILLLDCYDSCQLVITAGTSTQELVMILTL